MANAIFVFCKGLFSDKLPGLIKKLFSREEKSPLVVKIGDNNSGITYIFNGPVTITQTSALPALPEPLTNTTPTKV